MYVVYSSQPRHLRATVLQYNQRVHYILSNTVYLSFHLLFWLLVWSKLVGNKIGESKQHHVINKVMGNGAR